MGRELALVVLGSSIWRVVCDCQAGSKIKGQVKMLAKHGLFNTTLLRAMLCCELSLLPGDRRSPLMRGSRPSERSLPVRFRFPANGLEVKSTRRLVLADQGTGTSTARKGHADKTPDR